MISEAEQFFTQKMKIFIAEVAKMKSSSVEIQRYSCQVSPLNWSACWISHLMYWKGNIKGGSFVFKLAPCILHTCTYVQKVFLRYSSVQWKNFLLSKTFYMFSFDFNFNHLWNRHWNLFYIYFCWSKNSFLHRETVTKIHR